MVKYRFVAISADDLSKTEKVVNRLHKAGYELQAVSGKFLLMTIPVEDPMKAALAQIQALAGDRAAMELAGGEPDPLSGLQLP